MKYAFLFAGLLLLPASAAAFPDVPSAYEFYRPIQYLQTTGVLQGYPDGTFRPTGTINRAEFLKILVTGRNIEPLPDFFRECFPDVVDQWYAPYVCYARQAGWVDGYPDGTFGPERPVTFAEALKMLSNVRGYPKAPEEEMRKRGIDPTAWFAPYLTTTLLIDVVSFDQVWGDKAIVLQTPLRRGFVAQLLYRALLAEGQIRMPLLSGQCLTSPVSVEIKTYVDVLMPSRTNVFRQDIRGIDENGARCTLATDINPFGRVTSAYDNYFLQPYPSGQPKDEWTAQVPLAFGRAVVRGGKVEGAGFRPEVFVIDVTQSVLRQLPSIFAGAGGSLQSDDGRYVVFVGSAGYTLEAIDLQEGTHTVIDAVQPPLTFLSGPEGGQSVSLSFVGSNVVTYGLYDETSIEGDGYSLLETRTADIDATMNPTTPFDGATTPEPSEPEVQEIPFDESDSTVIDPNSLQFPEMP